MAEQQLHEQEGRGGEPHHQVSGGTVLCASIAGVAVGGPLIGMMGFSFLATVTLLLISSPLLIICSPLLIGAVLFITAAMAGFAASAVSAVAGLSAFRWVFRSCGGLRGVGLGFGLTDKLSMEAADHKVTEDQGKDWAGYLEQKSQNPEENRVNQG